MGEGGVIAGQIFNGISVASILLLAALGLALSFGVMNVINMAHGEMLMLGGYLSYLACRVLPGPGGFLVALVVAFGGTFLFGVLLEVIVIRRLYGRPLDTLLATWGISLILQQGARSLFGPIGVEVVAPHWLNGSVSMHGTLAGLDLPYVRLFIIVLAIAVLGLVALFIAKTAWGLRLRAVRRAPALCRGSPSRRNPRGFGRASCSASSRQKWRRETARPTTEPSGPCRSR